MNLIASYSIILNQAGLKLKKEEGVNEKNICDMKVVGMTEGYIDMW